MLKRLILTLGLVAFVAIGCGSPPTEEMNKAKASMKKAEEAKANVYMSEAYDAAAKVMKAGDDAVAKKEYDKAKASYVDAAKQFDASAAKTPDAITAAKTETDDFIKNCENAWGKNEKAMMMAAGKLKSDQKKEVEKMYADCKAKLKEAKDQFEAGDYKTSRATADEAAQAYGKINEKLTSKK